MADNTGADSAGLTRTRRLATLFEDYAVPVVLTADDLRLCVTAADADSLARLLPLL